MNKNIALAEVDISDNVYLQYDKEDTWIAIADKDSSWYDDLGSVIISLQQKYFDCFGEYHPGYLSYV